MDLWVVITANVMFPWKYDKKLIDGNLDKRIEMSLEWTDGIKFR